MRKYSINESRNTIVFTKKITMEKFNPKRKREEAENKKKCKIKKESRKNI